LEGDSWQSLSLRFPNFRDIHTPDRAMNTLGAQNRKAGFALVGRNANHPPKMETIYSPKTTAEA
jgi:hypothetical protein